MAAADAVIAEDTRVSHNLLAHYGVTTPLVAYHEHNAAAVRPHLLARLAEGAALALISDAGTPLVSDPGYKLVAEALAAGIAVTSVPGPSAVLAALVVAGLPTDRFLLRGFPAAQERGPARAHQRTRASCRRLWCSSNCRAASPKCWPISPPSSATVPPPWRAN